MNLRNELTSDSFEFLTTLFKGRKLEDGAILYKMTSSADDCPIIKRHKDGSATVWMELAGNEIEFGTMQEAVDFVNK